MSNILTNNINPRSGNLITIGGINDKVSIAGTLSYEDVSNIDSVGIITAQSGIHVTGGSVGIGTDNPTNKLEVEGSAAVARFVGNRTDALGPRLSLAKSRGSTSGSATIVQDGDEIGQIMFKGADGTDADSTGAAIIARVNGTPGVNDMPGALTFLTTSDGTNSPTERMRLDSSGRLLVGLTSAMTTGSNDLRDTIQAVHTAGAQLLLGRNDDTAVTTNRLGEIAFLSNDNSGGDSYEVGASIRAEFDQTPNDGDKPTAIAFKNCSDGSSTLTERMRIDSSGRLLVNTTSAIVSGDEKRLQIVGATNAGAEIILGRDDTVVASGNVLGALKFYGNATDGTTYEEVGRIQCNAGGTHSDTSKPGELRFSTTADSSTTPTERAKITKEGYFKATTNNGTYSAGAGALEHQFVQTSASNWTLRVDNATSTPYGVVVYYSANNPNSSDYYFLYGLDNVSTRFYVRSDGGIGNFQSNNVDLCDEREKKNIVDLDSTWDCLKNWELKKFHYNEDADDSDLRYGVIAQQIATHCPEVIADWVKQQSKEEILDEDGNVVTPAQDEIVRMGVKEQQMMWMAIKALQEAQTRIETLETANASQAATIAALDARLTALESA